MNCGEGVGTFRYTNRKTATVAVEDPQFTLTAVQLPDQKLLTFCSVPNLLFPQDFGDVIYSFFRDSDRS